MAPGNGSAVPFVNLSNNKIPKPLAGRDVDRDDTAASRVRDWKGRFFIDAEPTRYCAGFSARTS
jgi:hypothetical protein